MTNPIQPPTFDPIEIFLKGKTGNVLSIITNQLNSLIILKETGDKKIEELEAKLESMKESAKEAQETFKKVLSENEDKFTSAIHKKEEYIKNLKEQLAKFEQILLTKPNDTALSDKISQSKGIIASSEDSVLSLQQNLEKTTNDLNSKNEEFLSTLRKKNEEEIIEVEKIKKANASISQSIVLIDNLHRLATKNPNTLFKDNIPHDLILFAHKDKSFKLELNEFIISILKSSDYKEIIEKVGKIIEEVATKNRGLTVQDLVQVYSKLVMNIKNDGFEVLNKPLTHVFVDPAVEKALRKHRDDIKLPEILQIARLNIDIHQKILIHPICLDFLISLIRSEVKSATEQGRKFELPEIQWDALFYLTKKWTPFFRRFGNSLANFEDINYVRKFLEIIKKADLIIKNPICEEILDILIQLRESAKDTYGNGFGTRDYINLLYDTISMASTNQIRAPMHTEVLKTQDSIPNANKVKFLMMFDSFDVKRMLLQENLVDKDSQQSIFLKFNNIYLEHSELINLFQVDSFENIPLAIRVFLESLAVDPEDHLERMKVIIKKIEEFEMNISQSVVSADKTLPVVNRLNECVKKCCEYIDVPQALEKLIISKEMHVMLNRKANSK